jgi:hypothetical protein
MIAPAAHAARVVELAPRAPSVDRQITDYLMQLLGERRPRRVARMLDPGADKYRDLPKAAALTPAQLHTHASGASTYATTLDQGGMSRAGVIEVDQGGRSAVRAIMAAAERLHLACYALAVDNPLKDHTGGHVWFLYDEWYSVADIRAQIGQVVAAANMPPTTEIWPCNQVIRLPFGYHRWAKTRGDLILQSGEVLDLDSDLAGGLDLVMGLQPNGAPPAVSTTVDIPKTVTTVPVRRVSPGERAAGRASLDDVKARFNAEHPPADLLVSYGAVPYSQKDFSCPFGCGHTHSNTLYIYNGRIYSRSHNCKIPQKKGLDPFGVYVLIEHHDDVVAAAKALNPIEKHQRLLEAAQPATEYRTAIQVADAARKRAARRSAAATMQADVRARVSQDTELTDAERAIMHALLTIAGDRDWCRPSKEQIADVSGIPLGTVKRALFSPAAGGRLEGRYFRSQGKGGAPKTTAIRTFLRGSLMPDVIHESYSTCDRIPESVACEGGAIPPACENVYADSPEAWQWAADDHSADELTALECAPTVEPVPVITIPPARMALIEQLSQADDATFAAWYASHAADSQFENSDDAGDVVTGPLGAVAVVGGAAYVPDGAEAWYQAMQLTQICAAPPPGQVEQSEGAQLLDRAPEPVPAALMRRRRPRSELDAIDRYRLDLAIMEETALADELKKHHATLKKHAGAHWLDKPDGVRARLALVQAEIDARDQPAQVRRRRSVVPAQPADAIPLQLELLTSSSGAIGFALSLGEGSPPLTSSSAP